MKQEKTRKTIYQCTAIHTVSTLFYNSSSHVQSSYLATRVRCGIQGFLRDKSCLPPIRKISPHNERNFLLVEFLDSNLQRVRFTLKIDKHRSVHTDIAVRFTQHASSLFGDLSKTNLICRARVPKTRARSYLVMYGVVVRWSLGTFFSRACSITLPE